MEDQKNEEMTNQIIQHKKIRTNILMKTCLKLEEKDFADEEEKNLVFHKLFEHQRFLYFLYFLGNNLSGIQNYILYYLPGSGKTIAALAVLYFLNKYRSKQYNKFIIISKKNIIQSAWKDNKNDFITQNFKEKIHYFAYDDIVQIRDLISLLMEIEENSQQKNFIIIDEFHNIMKTVINNEEQEKQIQVQQKKRNLNQLKSVLYYTLKNCKNINILLLSGTPIYQESYEICLQQNLIQQNTMPQTKEDFLQYIDQKKNDKVNIQNSIQRRIFGTYLYFDNPKEENKENQDQNIFHENQQVVKLSKIVERGSIKIMLYNNQVSQRACEYLIPFLKFEDFDRDFVYNYNFFRDDFFKYYNQFYNKIFFEEAKRITLIPDFHLNIRSYIEDCNSKLLQLLYNDSPKYVCSILLLAKEPGNKVIYSKLVENEGLQCFEYYLNLFGVERRQNNFGNQTEPVKLNSFKLNSFILNNRNILWNQPVFFDEFSGRQTTQQNNQILNDFNSPENCFGQQISILVISQIAEEGITFKNVLQMHIMQIQLNDKKMQQIKARAIRQKSHDDYVNFVKKNNFEQKKFVDVFVFNLFNFVKNTKDEVLLQKYQINLQQNIFIDNLIKQTAIDYGIYKNQKPELYQKFNLPDLFYIYNQKKPKSFPLFINNLEIDLKYELSLQLYTKKSTLYHCECLIAGKQKKCFVDLHSGIVYDSDIIFPISILSKYQGFYQKKQQFFVCEDLNSI